MQMMQLHFLQCIIRIKIKIKIEIRIEIKIKITTRIKIIAAVAANKSEE